MDEIRSSPHLTGSTQNSQSSRNQTCSPEYAGKRARLMFGCYRRDEAADPETFVAAVTMILSRYPAAVVEAVTDPFSGIPSRKTERGYSGLPDVADVKEACEAEAAHQVRMASYAKMPRIEFNRPAHVPAAPGSLATIYVGENVPQYQRMKAVIKTADPRKWRKDENQRGIWVSWDLLDSPMPAGAGFKQFSEEQLREMYPPREAPTTNEAAE
jgi:hypothetical protein